MADRESTASDQSSGPCRVALYCRVSTADQSADSQLLDLRRFAHDRGWTVFAEFIDEGVSGTKDSRPALNRLMEGARKRRFDSVLVWRFDRFARSTKHLVYALEEFKALGIDFVSYQENIDTGSPLGAAIFAICAAMAQLERDIIAERVKAGLRRARERGKALGRPAVEADMERLSRMHREGKSLRQMARILKLSKSTVARMVRQVSQKPSENRPSQTQ